MNRNRSSAQRTRSKNASLVSAFNDMESKIEKHQKQSKLDKIKFIGNFENPSVSQEFLLKSPLFSDRGEADMGSTQEHQDVDYCMRNHEPRYQDRLLGITLY